MKRRMFCAVLLALVCGCVPITPSANDPTSGRPRTTWAGAREVCALWEPGFGTSTAAFNIVVAAIEGFRDDGVSRSYTLGHSIATCEDSQLEANVGACDMCAVSVADYVYP